MDAKTSTFPVYNHKELGNRMEKKGFLTNDKPQKIGKFFKKRCI